MEFFFFFLTFTNNLRSKFIVYIYIYRYIKYMTRLNGTNSNGVTLKKNLKFPEENKLRLIKTHLEFFWSEGVIMVEQRCDILQEQNYSFVDVNRSANGVAFNCSIHII